MKTKKPKRPKEVIAIDKVLGMINYLFPREIKKAEKAYEKTQEGEWAKGREEYDRGLNAYFVLKHIIKGATPIEYANSFPLSYFSQEDRKVIKNFLNFNESLFEVKAISGNRKDYSIEDIDGKAYLVKTIDFPDVLKEGEFIRAILIKNLAGDYFFYGNVLSYSREEGPKVKDALLAIMKKEGQWPLIRETPEIEWEIEQKKGAKQAKQK